jgi:hypothetical protein
LTAYLRENMAEKEFRSKLRAALDLRA